jgi:hypothetical protein
MGERRSAGPACHVRDHLDFLSNANAPLDRVVLVLNADSKDDIVNFAREVQPYKPYYTDLSVIIRNNQDFSYGGWNSAIDASVRAGNETDYFLMEDDYVPAVDNFIDIFYERMTDGVAYVCPKILDTHGQPHAAHSVGLLSGEAARLMVKHHGSPLLIAPAHNYSGVEWNQVHFLDNMTASGYKISDIADRYSVPFSGLHQDTIELGQQNAVAPIVPIGYNG